MADDNKIKALALYVRTSVISYTVHSFLGHFPVLIRRHPKCLPEHPGKVIGVLKSHVVGNAVHRVVGDKEKPGRRCQTDLADEFSNGFPGGFLEQAAERGLGHFSHAAELAEVYSSVGFSMI